MFLRIGRRIRITPAGESLLQLSHRVFQDLKDTVAGISDSQESLRGTMRLLGGMTVCLYVFPPLLDRAEAPAPGPRPEAHRRAAPSAAWRSCARAPATSALLTLPVEQPDLVTVPVLQEELLLVTAAKHPLSRKKQDAAAGPGPAAVRAVRVGLEHPAR